LHFRSEKIVIALADPPGSSLMNRVRVYRRFETTKIGTRNWFLFRSMTIGACALARLLGAVRSVVRRDRGRRQQATQSSRHDHRGRRSEPTDTQLFASADRHGAARRRQRKRVHGEASDATRIVVCRLEQRAVLRRRRQARPHASARQRHCHAALRFGHATSDEILERQLRRRTQSNARCFADR
jgi:hypothetical protein